MVLVDADTDNNTDNDADANNNTDADADGPGLRRTLPGSFILRGLREGGGAGVMMMGST